MASEAHSSQPWTSRFRCAVAACILHAASMQVGRKPTAKAMAGRQNENPPNNPERVTPAGLEPAWCEVEARCLSARPWLTLTPARRGFMLVVMDRPTFTLVVVGTS